MREAILNNLSRSDKYKAIDYCKHWVAILDKSNGPNAVLIRSNFLKVLRIPYRNSDKLPEGFRFFAEKLKEYKSNNDSAGLASCYFMLHGFHKITGLHDQGIYDVKKSLTYIDTVPEHEKNYGKFSSGNGFYQWTFDNGFISQLLIVKGEYESGIRYLNNTRKNHELPAYYFFVNSASAEIMLNQLDSVTSYLDSAETIAINRKIYDAMPLIWQTKAFYKIKTGAFAEAEMLLQQCHKIIDTYKLPANTPSGILYPDYYLALIRIQQYRFDEAAILLKKDIAWLGSARLEALRDNKLLAETYEKAGDIKAANETNKHFIALQDSLQSDQDKYRTISFEVEQQMNEKNSLSINCRVKVKSHHSSEILRSESSLCFKF